MTWRIAITHATGYRYRREVTSSYNEARITPISNDRQLVLESTVAVSPSAVAFRYWDYWGTLVHAFDIQVPHTELSVTGTSVVETSGRPDRPTTPCTWADLARPDLRDRFAELLAPTTHVPLDDDAAGRGRALPAGAVAGGRLRGRRRLGEGQPALPEGHHRRVDPAPDVLRQGSGVCQDFAHVALAVLRAARHPRPYVSGYLHPQTDGRAWASHGRREPRVDRGVDRRLAGRSTPPTGPVAERHVVVGRARDYADLSPLHGIFHGGPAEALGVSVELTRLS